MTSRRRASLTLALLAAMVGTLVVATETPSVAAVSGDDFNPGMIITDALFYDGDAMTASEVQRFLNERVPTCHPEWDDDPDDITCLKDYVAETIEKQADAYCTGYDADVQTAAEIIDGVARACGVSQKVLLVVLQRESSLVTHVWPSSWRYDTVMGYGCPDSGPGGSANCDPSYYGFFNQLYMAARQFKRYQANPTNYSYRAGRTNYILYHPKNPDDPSDPVNLCGTKQVYIENQATAGLYIYTPYVPNKAALDAGYGEGDGCSSYGNRNFFLLYNDWFGSTTGLAVNEPIASAYAERGGSAALGLPVAEQVKLADGAYQEFEKGYLFVTDTGIDTFRLGSSNLTKTYMAAGGPDGPWGWPVTDTETIDGVQYVTFEKAYVKSDNSVLTPLAVPSSLQDAWESYGYSALGRVTSEAVVLDDGVYQEFDKGYLYETDYGVVTFRLGRSNLTQTYMEAGGPQGPWGWPVTDTETIDGIQYVTFEKAYVKSDNSVLTPTEVPESLVEAWAGYGGYPSLGRVMDEAVELDGGVYQQFEAGYVLLTTEGVSTYRKGSSALTALYMAAGGPSGPWGWPLTDAVKEDGRYVVRFDNAWTGTAGSDVDVHLVDDRLVDQWDELGGWASLGDVLSDPVELDGGVYQQTAKGYIFETESGVETYRVTRSSLTKMYVASGGPSGPWGWPLTDADCDTGNYCIVQFENTTALSDDGDVTLTDYTITEPVFSAWKTGGGEPVYGLPTSVMYTHPGGNPQKFEKGVFYITPLGSFYRLGRSNLTKEYLSLGGSRGPWGWPTSNTMTFDGVQYVQFDNVTVVSDRGVLEVLDHVVPTELLPAFSSYGGTAKLGDPVADEVILDGGTYQQFARGYLFVTSGGIATYRKGTSTLTLTYMAEGGPTGPWGWPLTDAVRVGDAYVVEFEHVTVESRDDVLTIIEK